MQVIKKNLKICAACNFID